MVSGGQGSELHRSMWLTIKHSLDIYFSNNHVIQAFSSEKSFLLVGYSFFMVAIPKFLKDFINFKFVPKNGFITP